MFDKGKGNVLDYRAVETAGLFKVGESCDEIDRK
jgi:hypothetical protein